MMRTIHIGNLSPQQRRSLTRRSAVPDRSVRVAAADIVERVRQGGDAELAAAGAEFGGGPGSGGVLRGAPEFAAAADRVPGEVLAALRDAAAAITSVHERQRPVDDVVEPAAGVRVARRWAPLGSAAAYVPGGGAAYPSSLLMGTIPATIAGVERIVVASPADAGGIVPDVVLAAAHVAGIRELYVMGGAQAVAALAYGTETIEPVDKIVGPGNAWVTAAKLAVLGDVAVDIPAGPSESVIVTDGSVPPSHVAADVICQAEHGPDTPVLLITTSADEADHISRWIETHVASLDRAPLIEKALGDHGLIVVVDDVADALALAEEFAAEHLSLLTRDAHDHAERVTSAGSVFVGPWAPESAGDYATGANHILPTGGQARGYGPLGVEDFGSWRQVQTLTEEGLGSLLATIGTLADAEGFGAHRLAADIRFREAR